jgi:lipid II:glycine glycyltransferase (peptidoglycan interpeptide bridge formation enzyme)
VYSFEVIDVHKVDIDEYYRFKKKVLFSTVEWLNFIELNQKAKPFIIKITENSKFIGYFTGFLFTKFGIKIVASPFNGWTTAYMGFDVIEKYNTVNLIEPISKFIFKTFKCLYIQITDRFIEENELKDTKLDYSMSKSIELNINRTDDELFKTFKTDCRNYIRQFERRGAHLEIGKPDEQFATEYYEQLQEVFAKQGLVPTYGVSKVIDLFNSLTNDQLLCLRVRNPDGKCIATSIFVGFNERFYFWGAASFREFQFFRPNEYMIWTAIQLFREKGYKYFDMYGERPYKNKFSPEKISYPCIMIAKFPILIKMREISKKLVWMGFKIKGIGKKKNVGNTRTFKQEINE